MFQDLVIFYPLLVPFLLVLFRVLGLFVFVPLFSNASIPGNVKALLGLAIAVCVWHSIPRAPTIPAGLIGLTIAIAGEMSVGLLIGLLTALVFTGMQLGAHMVSQQMGLSMAAVYDPMFDEQSTAIEQVAFWLALMVFFVVGGHRELINTLVQSYQTVPMGHAVDPERMLEAILGSVQAAFHVAVRVGTPALVAFFLGTLASGFIAKSMPQMNLMTLGISVNLLIGFGMIMVGLAGWALVAGDAWQSLFATFARVLGG